MNKDWHTFWQSYRKIKASSEEDLLYQVGKTIKGEAISKEVFNILVEDVAHKLNLTKNDSLVDLCCGNGVLTNRLAQAGCETVGIDFSSTFMRNAHLFFKRENLRFLNKDAKFFLEALPAGFTPNKILIYDALAYFKTHELELIVEKASRIHPRPKILICSILDRNKKWCFFDTFSRKLFYLRSKLGILPNNGIGRWWSKKEIVSISKRFHAKTNFFEQPKALHTAHYRFDCLIYWEN